MFYIFSTRFESLQYSTYSGAAIDTAPLALLQIPVVTPPKIILSELVLINKSFIRPCQIKPGFSQV
jgi:hypothetical protein